MNLFGKKKAAAPNPGDAIAKLRETNDNLEKRENHLNQQAGQALAEAKLKNAKGDKKGAMFSLKKKKLIEIQVQKLEAYKMNILTQIMALESTTTDLQMVKAMQFGANVMKEQLASNNIDKVADVMEDIQEQMGEAEELSNALSTPLGPAIDEDELESELAELDSQFADEQMLALDSPAPPQRAQVTPPVVPAVKDSKQVVLTAPLKTGPISKEEQEFKELEDMMTM